VLDIGMAAVADTPGTATLPHQRSHVRLRPRRRVLPLRRHGLRAGRGPYVAHDSLFVPLQFFAEFLPRLITRYATTGCATCSRSGRAGSGAARGTGGAGAPVAPVAQPLAPPARAPALVRRPRVVAIDAGHGAWTSA